jgi:hypothetical protein
MIVTMDGRGIGIEAGIGIGILRRSEEAMTDMMAVIGTAIRNETARDRIGMMALSGTGSDAWIGTVTATETETVAVI